MSIRNGTICKLASMLYLTTTKIFLLLTNSFLKRIVLILPAKEEPELFEYRGEVFTLEDIAEILLLDSKEIKARLSRGETVEDVIESPTPA